MVVVYARKSTDPNIADEGERAPRRKREGKR
jgi:hypothetical protein